MTTCAAKAQRSPKTAKIAAGLPIILGGDFNTTETNSFGLKTYGKWTTQTVALSLLPNGVHGTVEALCLFNPKGALAGDAICIASIEFVK